VTVLAYERHPVHPDHRDAYTALLGETAAAMRSAPGALWADVAETMDDPPSFVVLSEWRTPADADAWECGPDQASFKDRSEPWLREAAVRRRFSSP
jgi:quinol monooxygenase YgiN